VLGSAPYLAGFAVMTQSEALPAFPLAGSPVPFDDGADTVRAARRRLP
jgi:hypothetical protein